MARSLPLATSSEPHIEWPVLSKKQHLDITVLEPDQILTVQSFLTRTECSNLIRLIDSLPLELTPPPKRGEATRVNQRASIQSSSFASTLFDLITPHLPDISSFQKHITPAPVPVLCNSNIRLYKYSEGQYFGQHYDESVPGPILPSKATVVEPTSPVPPKGNKKAKAKATPVRGNPTWSEWTILIYLSGQEDGVVGGETVFYTEDGVGKNKRQREIIAPLSRGTLLLHRHGKECLLHEGRLVQRGTKYVLRSDLLFGQP